METFLNPSPTTYFLQELDGIDAIAFPCVAFKFLSVPVCLSDNMTEANIVYSNVTFIKTKEKAVGKSLTNMFILLLLNDIPGTDFLFVCLFYLNNDYYHYFHCCAETTSTPEETTYSEVKVSKTKSPKEFVGK